MDMKLIKRRARERVNWEVKGGRLVSPNTLPCVDCGHLGPSRVHHYDHHQGYAEEHVFTVEAVCAPCHGQRSVERNEKVRRFVCEQGHTLSRNAKGQWRCRECQLAYWRAYNARHPDRKH